MGWASGALPLDPPLYCLNCNYFLKLMELIYSCQWRISISVVLLKLFRRRLQLRLAERSNCLPGMIARMSFHNCTQLVADSYIQGLNKTLSGNWQCEYRVLRQRLAHSGCNCRFAGNYHIFQVTRMLLAPSLAC